MELNHFAEVYFFSTCFDSDEWRIEKRDRNQLLSFIDSEYYDKTGALAYGFRFYDRNGDQPKVGDLKFNVSGIFFSGNKVTELTLDSLQKDIENAETISEMRQLEKLVVQIQGSGARFVKLKSELHKNMYLPLFQNDTIVG